MGNGRKKKWVIGYRRKKKWVISVKTLILRGFFREEKKWVIGYRRKKKWVISVKTLILRGFCKGKRDVLPIAKTRGSMAIKNNLYILMNML